MSEIRIDISKEELMELLELKGRFDAVNNFIQKSSYACSSDVLHILGIERRAENEEQNN